MIAKTVRYIKSSGQELKKVSWPTKQELIRYLATIIICLVLATSLIALIDYGLSNLIKTIFAA